MSGPATLKARTYVQACLRAAGARATPAYVVRRGYEDAGAVLIKLSQGPLGASVLAQTRRADGELVWMRGTGAAPVPDPDAEAYIAREVRRDPDVWVIEIEDREGRHPLGEAVL